MAEKAFTLHSLYIAGFTQARSPHLGLLIPISASEGLLYHIRIDRATCATWQFQRRKQVIDKDMFLSSLLRVHDASAGVIKDEQLHTVAKAVVPPDNDDFGECGPWVYRVLQQLHDAGLIKLECVESLAKETDDFADGNKSFARRDKFPNVAVSLFCQ